MQEIYAHLQGDPSRRSAALEVFDSLPALAGEAETRSQTVSDVRSQWRRELVHQLPLKSKTEAGRLNRSLSTLKESTMKKQIVRIAALTLFVATLAVASAHAQSPSSNQVVNIPFDFYVGGEKLPAGEYLVRAETSRTTMRIQRRDQSPGAYFSIRPVEGREIQNQSKLVFHKYGEDYFLSQVWTAGRAGGQELSRPERQRKLDREIARRMSKPESVSITMRAN
jgi:hypothetical protein